MRNTISTLVGTLVCAACAMVVAGSAFAADPTSDATTTRAGKRGQFRQRLFDQIDSNHDGVVSRAEYQAWVDSRFDTLDSNHDGRVDATEIAHSAATAERVQKRADGFVKRNGNGSSTVSKADFEAKAMARFQRLGNGADTLTIDQLGAGRGGFKHHRGMPKPDAATNPNG
ncbi:MAG: EF-hand domain-containing protein [Dokdonella sp.]